MAEWPTPEPISCLRFQAGEALPISWREPSGRGYPSGFRCRQRKRC